MCLCVRAWVRAYVHAFVRAYVCVLLQGDAKYVIEASEMETAEAFFSASHMLSTLRYRT